MIREIKIIFLIVLVIFVSISGLVFYKVKQAAAVDTKSTIASMGGCMAGGLLTPYAMDLIVAGKAWLGTEISGDTYVNVPVIDKKFIGKYTDRETVIYVLARCAAREVMDAMNLGMLDKIQTAGRDGGPSFVRNWRTFLTKAEYRGENIFRAELSQAQ